MLRSRKLKLDGPKVRDAACRRQPKGIAGGGFIAANGDDSSMVDDIRGQLLNQLLVNRAGRKMDRQCPISCSVDLNQMSRLNARSSRLSMYDEISIFRSNMPAIGVLPRCGGC